MQRLQEVSSEESGGGLRGNMQFEIVNKKDGTRLSHPVRLTSTTLFDGEVDAREWMNKVRLSESDYSIQPAMEKGD